MEGEREKEILEIKKILTQGKKKTLYINSRNKKGGEREAVRERGREGRRKMKSE